MKEIFFKFEKFFHVFSQKEQGEEEQAAETHQKGGQKGGADLARGPECQQVQQSAQGQKEGHEQAQPPVSRRHSQEEAGEGGEKAEKQVQGEPKLIQLQLPPQGGSQIVEEGQPGAAGQGKEGLQPLPSGIQTHQPSSLPNQPRRPGVLSA